VGGARTVLSGAPSHGGSGTHWRQHRRLAGAPQRLARAQRRLESIDWPLDRIATDAWFGSATSLRNDSRPRWHRAFGYRLSFRG